MESGVSSASPELIEERTPPVNESDSLQNSEDNGGEEESQSDACDVSNQIPEEETPESTVAKGEHIPAEQLSSNNLPDTTVNASVLSASELPSVGDKTITTDNDDSQDVKVKSPEEEHVASNAIATEEDKEEWMDVLGNGQLMKRVVHKGVGISTRPTPQCIVKVRSNGHLDSGDVVDKHSSCVFTVGDGDVIQAWDLAITLMEKGEIAEVKTDPRFAYGKLGRSPDIPPNASITYELELLDVQEPLDYKTISEDDIITAVDKKRVRGNELFQRQDYERAVNSYQKGLKMLQDYTDEQGDGDSSRIQDMQIRCWNNVAAAQLKVELFKEVLESCGNVLKKDPDNVKALFRSGKVLSQTGEMEPAIKHLQKALSLNPEEKAIKVELQRAVQKRDQVKQKEKAMYKRMVEGKPVPKTVKAQPTRENTNWGPLPYLSAAVVVATIGIGLAYFFTQRH